MTIPMVHTLYFAVALFAVGLLGVLVRRNVLFMLMSLELMLNAAGVAFVAGGARWGQPDGQVMYIFTITLAAAEVALALALVLHLYRRQQSLDIDRARTMRG